MLRGEKSVGLKRRQAGATHPMSRGGVTVEDREGRNHAQARKEEAMLEEKQLLREALKPRMMLWTQKSKLMTTLILQKYPCQKPFVTLSHSIAACGLRRGSRLAPSLLCLADRYHSTNAAQNASKVERYPLMQGQLFSVLKSQYWSSHHQRRTSCSPSTSR
jgi:hypothetical protein